ncbi:MAG: hypothetical protein WKF70_10945 [Chitinophagaceae bacterium]
MICTLLWLTISAPFVYASQRTEQAKGQLGTTVAPIDGADEECPVGSGEEKTSGGSASFSEEYLHDHHVEESLLLISLRYHKCENADDYIAYHGEVQVPPPNIISLT